MMINAHPSRFDHSAGPSEPEHNFRVSPGSLRLPAFVRFTAEIPRQIAVAFIADAPLESALPAPRGCRWSLGCCEEPLWGLGR